MDLRFYWNAAGQCFPLPERELEPEDARMDYTDCNDEEDEGDG